MRIYRFSFLMKSVFLVSLSLACASAVAKRAAHPMPTRVKEIPVAAQFREHLLHADSNHDGFVTRQELADEVAGQRDPATLAKAIENIMSMADANGDGKLSRAEVDAGARKTAEKAVEKEDVSRAKDLMDALDAYKRTHNGSLPHDLQQLRKLKLVSDVTLRCLFADGDEKAWRYKPNETSGSAITILSPGPVKSDGQYIAGLGDGNVIGIQDKESHLHKVAGTITVPTTPHETSAREWTTVTICETTSSTKHPK